MTLQNKTEYGDVIMKKVISCIIAVVILTSLLVSASIGISADERLKLSPDSNLTFIRGNVYITGICGTITADSLLRQFDGTVTLTSPKGEALTSNTPVPSDTTVSNGFESVKVLIYGDIDRNGKLSVSDVTAMLKYIAKWDSDICEEAIDLNWDNKRNVSDVTLLLKKIAGWNVCIGVDIIPEQITISYFDSDCTKIGVIWHTAKKTFTPAVQVVLGETDNFKNARTVYGITNIGMGDNNSRAVIDGLEFGKTYSYRVGDASGYWSAPASFTVREESPDSFTFLCFTDSQSKDSDSGSFFRDAWKCALASHPGAQLALHSGDIVEGVGMQDWRSMLDTSADYLRRIPTMVISGNHETSYAGSSGYKMQYNHFCTDMPEQSSYESGYFYSFDFGNVHFVMLNTNKQGTSDDSLSNEQITWLTRDLEENTAKWTVVLMHHPMYSTGSGNTDRWEDPMAGAMRAQLSPLFAEHGVDLVLAGHDHVYYCTHPIDGEGNSISDSPVQTDNGTVYYTNPQGVIYSTAGCTGSSNRGNCETHPEYYRKLAGDITKSYLAVTVENDRLTVDFQIPDWYFADEAVTLDSFGIIKP